jgi:hypothetical protein
MPETKISYGVIITVKGTHKTKPCISFSGLFPYISSGYKKFHGPSATNTNKQILYMVYGQSTRILNSSRHAKANKFGQCLNY